MSPSRNEPRTLLVALLLLWASCSSVPYTGRKSFLLLSLEAEIQLGLEAYPMAVEGYREIRRGPDHEKVQRVMRSLARFSSQPFDWEVKLLEAPEVLNAWCLPGGKMAVFTGILPLCRTDAGLAAVMSHEMAHAIARHGNERITHSRLAGLGLAITASILDRRSRHREEVMALLGAGATLGFILPYSRVHEAEADEIGLHLMVQAGYDPRAAVGLWRRMAKRGGPRPPEFLSTHPSPENRARRLERLIPGLLLRYGRDS